MPQRRTVKPRAQSSDAMQPSKPAAEHVGAMPTADGSQEVAFSALDKALLVLEAVVAHPRPVGLPDLTMELGLPRQTLHRILRQLADRGLLICDPTRDRYAIGPKLSKLSMAALRSANHGAPVRAILTDVVGETGETCNVGVLDGLEFVYLDRVECSWSLRVHLTAGSRVPAHCTSGGKILLAHLDPRLRQTLLSARPLASHTPSTMTDPDKLTHELAEIAERGFALNNEEFTIGVVGVAVPILDHQGRALAALAVHGPSPRFTLERARAIVPKLQTAALRLAEGWQIEAATAPPELTERSG